MDGSSLEALTMAGDGTGSRHHAQEGQPSEHGETPRAIPSEAREKRVQFGHPEKEFGHPEKEFGYPAPPELVLSDGIHPALGGRPMIASALIQRLRL